MFVILIPIFSLTCAHALRVCPAKFCTQFMIFQSAIQHNQAVSSRDTTIFPYVLAIRFDLERESMLYWSELKLLESHQERKYVCDNQSSPIVWLSKSMSIGIHFSFANFNVQIEYD